MSIVVPGVNDFAGRTVRAYNTLVDLDALVCSLTDETPHEVIETQRRSTPIMSSLEEAAEAIKTARECLMETIVALPVAESGGTAAKPHSWVVWVDDPLIDIDEEEDTDSNSCRDRVVESGWGYGTETARRAAFDAAVEWLETTGVEGWQGNNRTGRDLLDSWISSETNTVRIGLPDGRLMGIRVTALERPPGSRTRKENER